MEIDDRMLDEALGSYAGEEPRPGLERRVLARVAARRSWPLWMLAAACLVAILAIPRRPGTPATPSAPVPVAVATPASEPPAIVRRERTRPDRFPSPAPLTREERTWVVLANHGVVASLQSEEIEPIRIDDLTIPPLESEGGE